MKTYFNDRERKPRLGCWLSILWKCTKLHLENDFEHSIIDIMDSASRWKLFHSFCCKPAHATRVINRGGDRILVFSRVLFKRVRAKKCARKKAG